MENCEHCKTWEEEMYWTHFQTRHFCQILKGDFNQQLVIPKKFAGNMCRKLPPKLTLKCPSGAKWEVELVRSGDVMFLLDGWEDFVKACSLKENDILIFKYDGSSCVDVLIFGGESFCEKEAAYFVRKCGHDTSDVGNQKKRDSLENGDPEQVLGKRPRNAAADEAIASPQDDGRRWNTRILKKSTFRRASPVVGSARTRGPLRTARKRNIRYVEQDSEELNLNNPASGQPTNHEINGTLADESTPRPAPRGRGRPKRILPANPSQTLEALPALTENGEPDNQRPSSSQQSNLEDNGTIPKLISLAGDEYVSEPANGVASSSKQKSRTAKKQTPKGGEYYVSHRRAVTDLEKQKAVELAVKESTDMSFIVVMRPTCVHKRFYVTIPTDWVHKHLPRQNLDVVLRVGERTWNVKFNYDHCRTGGGFSTGWKAFALDNQLDEFDVCLFKVASQETEPIAFDVAIFRVVQEVAPLTLVVDF